MSRFDIRFNPIAFARFLLIAHTAGLFFSPPLTNLAEFLLWGSLLGFSDLRSRFIEFFHTRAGRLFLLFLFFLAVGVGVATLRGFVDYTQVWSWRKIFIFPIAATLFLRDDMARWRFAGWYVVFATGFSIYAIWSALSGNTGDVVRNSSSQSVLFALGVIAAGFSALNTRKLTLRVVFTLCLIACFSGLVAVTSGRSGYLGVVVMILALPIFLGSRYPTSLKSAVAVLLIAFSAVALYLSPVANSRIQQALNEFRAPIESGQNTSIGLRKIFWVNTLDMVPQYWLIGAGLTGFGDAYTKHMSMQADKQFISTIDPHNQFLKMLVEQGIIGLGIFVALLLTLLQIGKSSTSAALGACALLAWVATSFFSAHFTTFVEGRLIWVWLGVFLASQSVRTRP